MTTSDKPNTPPTFRIVPIVQIEKATLKTNAFMGKRFNIVMETAKIDEPARTYLQNKLNLALLAYWLENDAY